ncbi:2-ketoarginine methyltransferase [Nonomuraea sp. LPB2021202275-12-8]|uniref:2-ketoarginine methyltransferase n=1 Tax=Nonomuraea sp. LPB2021202275-12-8 TaxID=3120159 RepID=UPI00300CE0DF
MKTNNDFEHRLVEAIQPIRYMALAQALHQLHDSGIYGLLAERQGVSVREVAKLLKLNEERLQAYFSYLANEGYLVEEIGWRLTAKGAELAPFLPWYTLLVGGYAGTFGQIAKTLQAGAPFATREGAKVGAGSCGMSMYDALPLTSGLLDRLPDGEHLVVDLGCGDAAFLVELCKMRPEIRGVGVDPDAGSVELARRRVADAGLADRITIRQGTAADALTLDLPDDGSLCFLTSFVLQEMLEQDGVDAVRTLVKTAFQRYPAAHWVVVEVDHQPDNRKIMAHGLGVSYYNPYFLLHALTEQRLVERGVWESLFAEADAEVVAVDHPAIQVDSTELELGYLLRAKTA